MTYKEIIYTIQDICGGYELENDCPFFNEAHDDCVFHLCGLKNPCDWKDEENAEG